MLSAVQKLKTALDLVDASKSALVPFTDALASGRLRHRDGMLYVATVGIVFAIKLKPLMGTHIDASMIQSEAKRTMLDLSASGLWCAEHSEGQECISEELFRN